MLEGCVNQKYEEFYQSKKQAIVSEEEPAVDLEAPANQLPIQDTMER